MFAGEIEYGDTAALIQVAVRKADGTPQSLAGASNVKLVLRAADGRSVSLAGVVGVDPDAGLFSCAGGGTAFDPGSKRSVLVECRGEWTIATLVGKSRNSFHYSIVKFP